MRLFSIKLPLDNVGPNREAHNERIKLFAVSLNAVGLASLIGGLLSPLLDPMRGFDPVFALAGTALWMICLLAAFEILGYMKAKD